MADEVLHPGSAGELADIVAQAADAGTALKVEGRGTKDGWGRPVDAPLTVSTAGLAGISLYEPEELVLSAAAGTPISAIRQSLEQHNQFLPFEPPDLGALWGAAPDSGTLGGVIAANLSGSRRLQAGAARDHLLGFEAVNGRGELFKSGGRVVKNVTGFDLSKLMAGSFGTLVVMTSITIKVLPNPEKTRTVLLYGLNEAVGIEALSRALQSPLEVNGAAYLPAQAASRSTVEYVSGPGKSVTAIRLQGPGPSVETRCEEMRALVAEIGEAEELHFHNSKTLWEEIGNVGGLLGRDDSILWRLSVAPTDGPVVAQEIANACGGEAYFDWGGGLIWLSLPADEGCRDGDVRGAVTAKGGHATLLRAPEEIRREVFVFEPQAAAVAGIQTNLKNSFDPKLILNPGRMYPEARGGA